MIKTGVMQFGFAPVFYIRKLVEILKDTFVEQITAFEVKKAWRKLLCMTVVAQFITTI